MAGASDQEGLSGSTVGVARLAGRNRGAFVIVALAMLAVAAIVAAAPAPAQDGGGDPNRRIPGNPIDRFASAKDVGTRAVSVLFGDNLGAADRRRFAAYRLQETEAGELSPVGVERRHRASFEETGTAVESAAIEATLDPGTFDEQTGRWLPKQRGGTVYAVAGPGSCNDDPCLFYVRGEPEDGIDDSSATIDATPDPGSRFELALGDYADRGIPDVTVAWVEGSALRAQTFRISASGEFEAASGVLGPYPVDDPADPAAWAITSGDFFGEGRDQLAIYTREPDPSGGTRSRISVLDREPDAAWGERISAPSLPGSAAMPVDAATTVTMASPTVERRPVRVEPVRVDDPPPRDTLVIGLGREGGFELYRLDPDEPRVDLAYETDAVSDPSRAIQAARVVEVDDVDDDGRTDLAVVGASVANPDTGMNDRVARVAVLQGSGDPASGWAPRPDPLVIEHSPETEENQQAPSFAVNRFDVVDGVPLDLAVGTVRPAPGALVPPPGDPEQAAPQLVLLRYLVDFVGDDGVFDTGFYLSQVRFGVDEDGNLTARFTGDPAALDPDDANHRGTLGVRIPPSDAGSPPPEFPVDENEYNQLPAPPRPAWRRPKLALGTYDGVFKLGEPRVTGFANQEPLVVLNASPTHWDAFGSQVFDVNRCWGEHLDGCGFFSTYATEQNLTEMVSSEINDDWTLSTALSGGADLPGGISVELTARANVGKAFSRVEQSTESVQVALTTRATNADQMYVLSKRYDLLEYPVYIDEDDEGEVEEPGIEYVLQVTPSVESRQWINVHGNLSSEVPDHQPGHLLSYPPIGAPPVVPIAGSTFGEDEFEVTPTSNFEYQLTQERVTETGGSDTLSWGWGAGVAAEIDLFVKASAEVNFDMSGSQVKTAETTIGERTDIQASLGGLDPSLGQTGYRVRPFAYYGPYGALVLDYMVEPDRSGDGVDTFWERRYGRRPDPTFVLPNWRLNEKFEGSPLTTDALQYRTRDIAPSPDADPDSPGCEPQERGVSGTAVPGGEACAQVVVRNLSLEDLEADTTSLSLYAGDPDVGGQPIAATEQSLPKILARRSTPRLYPRDGTPSPIKLDFAVNPAEAGRSMRVFAALDQEGEVAEVHDDNNKGFQPLRVASDGAGGPVRGLPFPPANVEADPAGTDAAEVSWEVGRDLDPDGAAEFIVRAYRDGDPQPEASATIPIDGNLAEGAPFSAVVDALEPGKTYRFAVFTSFDGGEGPVSHPSEPVVLPDGLDGVPGPVDDVTTEQRPDGAIEVCWRAPHDGGDSPITSYRITPSGGAQPQEVGAAARCVTFADLDLGLTYTFVVRAVNDQGPGPVGPGSATDPTTSADLPGQVTDPEATPGPGSVIVNWNEASYNFAPITSYEITVIPLVGGFSRTVTVGGDSHQVVIDGLSNGVQYKIEIVAVNAVGKGPIVVIGELGEQPIVPAGLPGPPRGLLLTAGDGEATLRWATPLDDGGAPVTGYRVQTVPGWLDEIEVDADQREVTLGPLPNGRPVRAVVAAVNDVGRGPESEPSNEVTPTATPPVGANIELERVKLRRRKLTVGAAIDPRATGRVKVLYRDERTVKQFRVPIAEDGGIKLVRRLPKRAARARRGTLELTYRGNDTVLEDRVGLRGLRRPRGKLRVQTLRTDGRRLVLTGRVAPTAAGLVKVRLAADLAGGEARHIQPAWARVRNGRWRAKATMPRSVERIRNIAAQFKRGTRRGR